MFRSFKEWNNLGFYIRKGERSYRRDDRGNPLFSEDQVKEKRRESRREEGDRGYDPFFGDDCWDDSYLL